MKVKRILAGKSSEVITIQPEQTLQEASQLLTEYNIGAVLVVNGDGKPAGILSERDIVRKLAILGRDSVTVKVSEAMTSDLIIAVPEDDLSYVMNTMTEKHIRHLPVMQDQKLVGIISIGDVVKAQRDHFAGEARTLQQYIDGGYG